MNRPCLWACAIASFLLAFGGCEAAGNGEDLVEIPFVPLTEELRIGAVDDPEYAFNTVLALEVSSIGTIFSVHIQEFAVRRWSAEGEFEGTIGRRGEGPGEFIQPWRLGWHGDSLWVFDSSLGSRITFFDGDGAYVGVLTPQVDTEPSSQGIYPARPAGLLADGTIYGVTPAYSHAVLDGTLTSLAHVRMNSEGRTVDTLLVTPVDRSSVLGIVRDGGGTFTSQTFGDADLAIVTYGGGGLLTLERKAASSGVRHEFRLTQVDLQGDTVFSRSYPYQPVSIPSDTIQKAVESIAERFRRGGDGTSLEQWHGWVRDAMYIPDYYSPISAIASGRDGTMWLARNPAGEGTMEWLILDRSGEPVGRTETPAGFRLLLADMSTLWGFDRDELDVPYIVRYRLELQ